MGTNVSCAVLLARRYPYLLPNLVLSCLAMIAIPLVIFCIPETRKVHGEASHEGLKTRRWAMYVTTRLLLFLLLPESINGIGAGLRPMAWAFMMQQPLSQNRVPLCVSHKPRPSFMTPCSSCAKNVLRMLLAALARPYPGKPSLWKCYLRIDSRWTDPKR